ncbi:DUF1285 domain-containing protein [Natronospirillum operosum]|uniref:DUF1285 domain-containing protein n=1 Tax=Natronospirillum operosum TaxID=2759953 RepID=A0A4Z0WBV2_9GAMM|nr:DUF1285 domain-containing protein [Natronospirillum operosum]TGG95632.1 DUF1285 domain-containing protein [Natronospirillum operosum]
MLNLESIGRELPPGQPFRRPPTERWQPEHCGDIDIRIDAQGQWFHEGLPIRRAGLLRLLASVLVREEGNYWLKTPVEKMRIQVDDAPFVVQELNRTDTGVAMVTNVGEVLALSSPWTLQEDPDGELRPWIALTDTLGARLSRNLFYHLSHEAVNQTPDASSGDILYWPAGGQQWPLGRL